MDLCNQEAAVEADANREQQLKWIYAIRKQQLKQMQSGCSNSAQRAVRAGFTYAKEGEVAVIIQNILLLHLLYHHGIAIPKVATTPVSL